MSKIKLVLFSSSLLLVAGQALAAPTHLPHSGRTAVDQRMSQHGTDRHSANQHSKAHAGHGHEHHGWQQHQKM